MPDHMRLDNWPVPYPLSTVLTSTFTALCMVSYGQKDLEDAWKLAVEDGKAWTERMDRLGSRISAVNIIVSRFEANSAEMYIYEYIREDCSWALLLLLSQPPRPWQHRSTTTSVGHTYVFSYLSALLLVASSLALP